MKKNYRIAGWLLLLFYSFFSAYFNVHDGFININKREYESVKKALTVQVDPTTATVYYIPPPMKLLVDNDLIERVITDEYGRLSNSSPWAPKPMIQLILGREREVAIKVYQGEPLHANEALIDMGKVYLDYVSNDH